MKLNDKQRNWIAERKKYLIILGLGIAASIASYFLLQSGMEARGLTLLSANGDSQAYKKLAENIFFNRAYSFSDHAPFYPDSLRTPGYPFFSVILFSIFRNWNAVLFVQGLLLSAVPLAVYAIGRRLNEKVAFASALIFVFMPNRLIWSNALMTDGLFVLTVLLSVLSFCWWLDKKESKRLLLCGLFIGLSIMVRPLSMLYWIAFLPIIIFVQRKEWKIWLRNIAIFCLGVAIFTAPWSIRNKIRFNSWQLSPIGSYSFAYANAILFSNYKTGQSLDELYKQFSREVETEPDPLKNVSLAKIPDYNRFAGKLIGDDKFQYLKWHLVKAIPFFMNDGLRDSFESYGFISQDRSPNFSNLFLGGNFFSGLVNFLRAEPVTGFLFIFGTAFWLAVTLLAFLSLPFDLLSKRRLHPEVTILYLSMFYFAGVSAGPVSQPRYRLPIEGMMLLLAGLAIIGIIEAIQAKLANLKRLRV